LRLPEPQQPALEPPDDVVPTPTTPLGDTTWDQQDPGQASAPQLADTTSAPQLADTTSAPQLAETSTAGSARSTSFTTSRTSASTEPGTTWRNKFHHKTNRDNRSHLMSQQTIKTPRQQQ
jgi:hypothetical protein